MSIREELAELLSERATDGTAGAQADDVLAWLAERGWTPAPERWTLRQDNTQVDTWYLCDSEREGRQLVATYHTYPEAQRVCDWLNSEDQTP